MSGVLPILLFAQQLLAYINLEAHPLMAQSVRGDECHAYTMKDLLEHFSIIPIVLVHTSACGTEELHW